MACVIKWKRKENDITGQTFNRLTAIKRVGLGSARSAMWLFKCSCGGWNIIKKSTVTCGVTKSCGCFGADFNKERRKEKSPRWLGEEAKEESVLRWVNKNFPKKKTCEFCGRAQIGARALSRVPKWDVFTRNPLDYFIMCVSCMKQGFNRVHF